MYKNILLARHSSATSERGVNEGIALARALKAKVTAIAVTAPFNPFDPAAEEYLDFVDKTAKAAGIECETIKVSDAAPYRAVIGMAHNKNCSLILVQSLCSETVKILTHSPLPVLIHGEAYGRGLPLPNQRTKLR